MLFCRRPRGLSWLAALALVVGPLLVGLLAASPARAQGIDVQRAALIRAEEGYFLEADFEIALTHTLEDALNKGVPLYFALEFELIRPRWYWFNEKLANSRQQYRLSYNALARQYRVGVGKLYQNFSALPEALAFLSREIEFTQTLLFESGPSVRVLGGATPPEIAVDVLRAGALGTAVSLAMTLALGISFRSLALAFAQKGHPAAPLRVLLYRSWLLPFAFLLAQVAGWLVPDPTVIAFAQAIPFLLLFSSMRATARMGSGAGPFSAIVVVLVPFVFMLFVGYFAELALAPYLPDPETLRAAAEATPPS
jgi:hypothetical protein